jgi:hypothetical protein
MEVVGEVVVEATTGTITQPYQVRLASQALAGIQGH